MNRKGKSKRKGIIRLSNELIEIQNNFNNLLIDYENLNSRYNQIEEEKI